MPLHMKRIWLSGLGLLVWGWAGLALADWNFARIIPSAERLYGPLGEGRQRLEGWQQLLGELVGQTEAAQLQAVNSFFNQQLAFADDPWLWGQADYWATPVEALHQGAGDCEDFALAKYISLRYLGVPSEKLRITYVKALKLSQAHMVLAYYPRPQALPLVLDNLEAEILPAEQRDDLLPVYAFNGEGLWFPGESGNRRVGDSKRLSRWQDLLRKMAAEGFPGELH
jgi:predicted transglutaminase-like cysteine proteinase